MFAYIISIVYICVYIDMVLGWVDRTSNDASSQMVSEESSLENLTWLG